MTQETKAITGNVHSSVKHSEDELAKFNDLGIKLIPFDPAQMNEVQYLIIGGQDDISQWNQYLLSNKNLKFISWGLPQKIDQFLLNRTSFFVSPNLFAECKEYRKLMLNHIYRQSSLHLQDKFEASFDSIITASIVHPLRFGSFIDQIMGYSHERNFPIVPLRHFSESLLLFLAHLKQLGKIQYPAHVEYACNDKVFVFNVTVHTTDLLLEYLLEFFNKSEGPISKNNILFEVLRSTHYMEVAHFPNAQKLSLNVMWTKNLDFQPSMSLFDVESAHSNWNDDKMPNVINSEDILDEAGWENLENKKILGNEDLIEINFSNPETQLARDPAKLKALMAEALLQKLSDNPDKIDEDIQLEELQELINGSEAGEWLGELSEEDKEEVLAAINNPVAKKKLLKEIKKAKDFIEESESNQNLKKKHFKDAFISELIEEMEEDQLDQILDKTSPLGNKIESILDELFDEDGEQELEIGSESKLSEEAQASIQEKKEKKEKIKKLLKSKQVNVNHPFIAQALESLDADELDDPELVKEKLSEIAKFVKNNANLKNPKIQRALDAFNNNDLSYEELQEIVAQIKEGKLDKVSTKELEKQLGPDQDEIEELVERVANSIKGNIDEEKLEEIKEEIRQALIKDGVENADLKNIVKNIALKINEDATKLGSKKKKLEDGKNVLTDIGEIDQENGQTVGGTSEEKSSKRTIGDNSFTSEEVSKKVKSADKKDKQEKVTLNGKKKKIDQAREVINEVTDDLSLENIGISGTDEEEDQAREVISDVTDDLSLESIGISGEDEEENQTKQVVNEVTDDLSTEETTVAGKKDKKKNAKQVVSDIEDKLKDEMTRLKAKKKKKDSFLFSLPGSEEEAQISQIIAQTLKDPNNLSSINTIKTSLGKQADKAGGLTQQTVRNNKDLIAQSTMMNLQSLAQKLGKSVNELTQDEISKHSSQLVKEVTHRVIEEVERVKENFLENQLVDSAEAPLTQLIPDFDPNLDPMEKLELVRNVLSQQLNQNFENIDLSQLLNMDLLAKTDLSFLKDLKNQNVYESMRVASKKVEKTEKSQIIDRVVGTEEEDDDSKLTLKAKMVDNEIEKTTVQEPKIDQQALKRLDQAEANLKRVQSENLKLKADLQAQKILAKKEEAQKNRVLHEEEKKASLDLSSNDKTTVKEKENRVHEKPDKTIVSEQEAKEEVKSDDKVIKKLELDLKTQEDFYQEELRKLALDNEKKKVFADKLKQDKTQIMENYTKKINELEKQLSSKPIIRELLTEHKGPNPELDKVKDENEKLKKIMDRYKERVNELAQKVQNNGQVGNSVNNHNDKTRLEREVFDLKDKLKRAEAENLELERSPVELKEKRSLEREANHNSSTPNSKEPRASLDLSANSNTKDKSQERTSTQPLIDQKTVVDLRVAKDENLHLQKELTKTKNELTAVTLELKKNNDQNQVDTKKSVSQVASDKSTTSPLKSEKLLEQSQQDMVELKKKFNQEVSLKNNLQNRVSELEKSLKAITQDDDSVSISVNKNENKSNATTEVQKQNNIEKEKTLKKELAEVNLRYSQSQNELIALKVKLQDMEEAETSAQMKNTVNSNNANEISNNNATKQAEVNRSQEDQEQDITMKKDLIEANNKMTSYENKIAQLEKQLGTLTQNQSEIQTSTHEVKKVIQVHDDAELKKDLSKARENEQNMKKEYSAALSKLTSTENKVKDLEDKLQAILGEADGANAGATGGGNKSQVSQLQNSNKKLVSDLMKAQQAVADSKKDLNTVKAASVTLQNKVVQLQKDLDKIKKSRAA